MLMWGRAAVPDSRSARQILMEHTTLWRCRSLSPVYRCEETGTEKLHELSKVYLQVSVDQSP